eukprot:5611532-Pyramimonas_sp.AAC.1
MVVAPRIPTNVGPDLLGVHRVLVDAANIHHICHCSGIGKDVLRLATRERLKKATWVNVNSLSKKAP